ncbi:hypothetical protein DN752_17400 [Echinicola strongylocentroti]|uniref:Uncharacterized protein n=1 Tax=Echinicola strongylocentroti TaxID=1795355 RepID=A0A2Z4IKX9_9BACT|nr:hypothetical protein DN752_17400 [Echinicola strongylocentroti]
MDSFEKLNRNGYFTISHYSETQNTSLTQLTFQNENELRWYHILCDLESQKCIINKLDEKWGDLFIYPQGSTNSDQFIFSTLPAFLYEVYDKSEISRYYSIDDLDKNGNPVIIFAHLNPDFK